MFDLRAIRSEPAKFDENWARRNIPAQTPEILKLDEQRRAVQTQLQDLQAKRNSESQKIGEIKKNKGDASAQMALVAAMKDDMAKLEEQERVLSEQLNAILSGLPNMLADDVPQGKDENDNKEVRKWGTIKKQKGEDHADIGEKIGLMDFETAAKMSGARFTLLSGGLARLERALAQFFLDTHTSAEHGFTEVSPPLLVHGKAMYGTGQLPKFEDDLYKTARLPEEKLKELVKERNELVHGMSNKNEQDIAGFLLNYEIKRKIYEEQKWLIPTSEVPLTNIVADMIIDEEYLPRRYTAFTPCFRSEAGSAGRDTRGMLRQHQFYKVEMVSVTAPEKSEEEQQHMVSCAETVLKKLELPFRTIMLCSGDTGFGARRTYDIEVWLPGQERYREISSVSNCWDFQARRMNARTRAKGEKDTRFVHTLNGSGVAVGRALIAVMENYHDPSDGGIFVPDALKPYMGGITKITK
jgi:seryl-tRNA synthetase